MRNLFIIAGLLMTATLLLVILNWPPQRTGNQSQAPDSPPLATQVRAVHQTGMAEGSTSAPLAPKVIRQAEITLELDHPSDGQKRLTEMVEESGGYLANTEMRYGDNRMAGSPPWRINITVRVPSTKFHQMLTAIRTIGQRVLYERVSGQDVTEEFIDLEAQLRTKQALENQFLEILKRATRVTDALEVQRQVAEVRQEIERLEGRRRYLENQTTYATITVTLEAPPPVITTSSSGFMTELKRIVSDCFAVAVYLILGVIRLVLVLIPVGILIILPAGLVLRYLWRRLRPATPAAGEPQPGQI